MIRIFRLVILALLALAASGQTTLKANLPVCEGGDRELADRNYFVLCHSSDLKIPLWVGYELTKADLDGPAERPSGFREDKELKSPGAKDSDYKGSGYSRGHMAPAEDFSRSDEAIKTTFLLSNVVPQEQFVNGGRWSQLESMVREIVRESGRAYIITGPLFARSMVDTIGEGEVGIPTHTFKVVLALGPGDVRKMYAFVMPNADNVTKPVKSYATTVRKIEGRTGFDFFSGLDDAEERRLETKKEIPVVSKPLPGSSKPKKSPAGHK